MHANLFHKIYIVTIKSGYMGMVWIVESTCDAVVLFDDNITDEIYMTMLKDQLIPQIVRLGEGLLD